MIRLFCGADDREIPGLHVFMHSVLRRASQPVELIPLTACGLPQGSNAFTLSRFLVAHMCNYRGRAAFCDAADMLMLEDVARLYTLFDDRYAVQVVKHQTYHSLHTRKYVGTPMECEQTDYERKNWASVMLVNCEHPGWAPVAESIATARRLDILQFRFLADEHIGELPPEWNVLVDEDQDAEDAKLLHWTAGVPLFWHYRNARRSQDWYQAYREVTR